jgi:hypothetical protein
MRLQLQKRSHYVRMGGVILLASFFRLFLLLSHWPGAQGDESVMALMAWHITVHGEHPVFFYGQNYLGALEAYLCAPLFWLFGPNILLVRLLMLGIWIAFLLSMAWLTTLLYTRAFALAVIVLFSVGMVGTTLSGGGGYPELPLLATLLFALALKLAYIDVTSYPLSKRLLLFTLWGGIAGLALWADLLILPVLVTAGGMLCYCCGSVRSRWRMDVGAWLCLVGGLVAGASPLLWYNLTAAPGTTSWDALLQQVSPTQAAHTISLIQRLGGAVVISVPTATGANPLCAVNTGLPHLRSVLAFFTGINPHPLRCFLLQSTWSAGVFLCWGVALFLALLGLWRMRSHRRERIQQTGRTALLLCAALIFLPFAFSTAPALFPNSLARYLILFVVVLPALLWPLWAGLSWMKMSMLRGKLVGGLCLTLLALILATYMRGTFPVVQSLPQAQSSYAQRQHLIADLLARHITVFYSEYWICNPLIFESQERLICSNLQGEQLRPGQDRYLPYHDLVARTTSPAYVFPVGSLEALGMDEHKIHLSSRYTRLLLDGCIVYTILPNNLSENR